MFVLTRTFVRLCAETRVQAARILNALYDGVEWQAECPLDPTVVCVGNNFQIESRVGAEHFNAMAAALLADGSESPSFDTERASDRVRLMVCGPSFKDNQAPGGPILTMHPVTAHEEVDPDRGEHVLRFVGELPAFPRAGFYDWRLVLVGADGELVPVTGLLSDDMDAFPSEESAARAVEAAMAAGRGLFEDDELPTAQGELEDATDAAVEDQPGRGDWSVMASYGFAQGRFIVQRRGLRQERVRVLQPDTAGLRVAFEHDQHRIVRHGTFEDVERMLPQLQQEGVTTVVLMGALERDNRWGAGDEEEDDSSEESDGGMGGVVGPDGMMGLRTGGSQTESTSSAGLIPDLDQEKNDNKSGNTKHALLPDANVSAPVCRHTPNKMLGGT